MSTPGAGGHVDQVRANIASMFANVDASSSHPIASAQPPADAAAQGLRAYMPAVEAASSTKELHIGGVVSYRSVVTHHRN